MIQSWAPNVFVCSWLPPPLFCVLPFSSLPLAVWFFLFVCCALPMILAFAVFRPQLPWALALCVVCFVGLPLLCSLCAFASSVCPISPLIARWWLPPAPPHPLSVSRFSSPPLRLFFSFVVRPRCLCPRCLWPSLVSGLGSPGLWPCLLFVLLASHFSARCALSPLLCFPPGRWLIPGSCRLSPPPLCLAVFVAASGCSVFFSRFAPPLSLAFCCFRPWEPRALALCVVCSPRELLSCPVWCFFRRRVVWCCGPWCVLCLARCCVACLCLVGFLCRVVVGHGVLFLLCFAVVRCCKLCWFLFLRCSLPFRCAPGCFGFCALLVRCGAGVPVALLSVCCPLAPAALAGILCCCLLCSRVSCWAWLSSVVSC